MHSASAFLVGIDVGSTSIKAVVDDAGSGPVWQDYARHEGRQAELLLDMLGRFGRDCGVAPVNTRVFVTGAGGALFADLLGGRYVQEVTALAAAVARRHPEAGAVVELGGQHAKILVFRTDAATGRRRKSASMNDKCAGGTGAVIDKIAAKLGLSPERLGTLAYTGVKLHQVAGKCGVFAETDINGLQKQGIPAEELMASLFDAIVRQNLAVLARGQTLHPDVVLLGGPMAFLPGVRDAWRHHVLEMWRQRQVALPEGAAAADRVYAPPSAEYYGAIGAVEWGREEPADVGRFAGVAALADYLRDGRRSEKQRSAARALVASSGELDEFRGRYERAPFLPPAFAPGHRVQAFVGVDGGSTSTKAVLLSPDGDLLGTAYQLSRGNPIQDTIDMFAALRAPVEAQGAALEVLGVGTTGYAKDIVRAAIGADVALVETVAHTQAALHYYRDVDVIADVGGQDIKLIFLRDGRVADFRLNTQCSAGNGYYLQSTAESFGLQVEQYADAAFAARAMPVFGYGCAVFLQSDIVNFVRMGWQPDEILAGLAAVLPRNVWLYVAKMPNLPALGSRFVLQGGTQNNLAAVKAQVDFIRSRFQGTGREPDIVVHRYAGEAGAIGTAMEAARLWREGRATSFVGLDRVGRLRYRTTRGEETRCHFCANRCPRTFIDIATGDDGPRIARPSGVGPDQPGRESGDERRLIVAGCEQGMVEDAASARSVKAGIEAQKRGNPNLVDLAAREVWKSQQPAIVADPPARWPLSRASRIRTGLAARRSTVRIGIPRVLNMYACAPLFSAYLESLGVPADHLVYSGFTSEALYRRGSTRGAIDPCYPSKVALAHVHDLVFVKHPRRALDVVFFPMVDSLRSFLRGTQASDSCPTVAATPEAVKAAFSRERDEFAQAGIQYLSPLVSMSEPARFERQMLDAWGPVLGVSPAENTRAIAGGFAALDQYEARMRRASRAVIEMLERERRVGIVMLGRPYHHDPGLNHGILDELQKRGYPILSQSTLPTDDGLLDDLFGAEIEAGLLGDPLEISDVWQPSFSANTNDKLWAAKFTARHPNLVALEVSSFKCGLDAPIFSAVEAIVGHARTPYFAFKDIDENRPTGSIKLRVETIDYFLTRYREELVGQTGTRAAVAEAVAAFERGMRAEIAAARPGA
jgi:activator of 2-hydroxyglutaryl-CoA dehydratase/predicted nucleotide-binding protein (sugar kinase/HSP70/actin superfamily)